MSLHESKNLSVLIHVTTTFIYQKYKGIYSLDYLLLYVALNSMKSSLLNVTKEMFETIEIIPAKLWNHG